MHLKREIETWDGKSSHTLRKIFDRHKSSPSFLADLINHAQSEALQPGATWLIKRFVEHSDGVGSREAQQILSVIPELREWSAKLHILQCLPHLPIHDDCRTAVESLTRACIIDDRKFLRAWGYGGFYELARQFPQYREEADRLMEIGLRDEPASVRARIRKATARGIAPS